MKFKSIIACGLLLLGVGASTTSCEDMFTAENNLVETDFAPKDTVYQVMGIIQRMQVLAERSVLLGEMRADLVSVDPAHSTTYVQELANNEPGSIEPYDYATAKGNIYNQPSDYYAVINNCNIYLAHVDSLRRASGMYYFKKEIIGVKTFRAWCYLELAKIYGEVPFITEPVVDAATADKIVNSASSKKGMAEILDFLIDDLDDYAYESTNDALRPEYGKIDDNFTGTSNLFIPVRVMLGELYLWRGTATGNKSDFVNAVRMYHDYLAFPNEAHNTQGYAAQWYTSTMNDNEGIFSKMYSSESFVYGKANTAGIIPMDTIGYYGNYTDLRNIFNSTYKNNYYPAVTYSDRLKSISTSQRYCYYYYVSNTNQSVLYGSDNKNDYTKEVEMGDLRLASLFNTRSNPNKFDASYSDTRVYNAKYTAGETYLTNDQRLNKIPYFRINTLYLHLAEALNNAGFPETAFAILKYGLTEKVLMDRSKISLNEFQRLGAITSYGFSQTSSNYTDELNNSFLVWDEEMFANPNKNVNRENSITIYSNAQIGIHSLGSGDSEYNEYYVLPVDSSSYVEVVYPTEPQAPVWDKKNDADSTVYKAEFDVYVADLALYNDSLDAAILQDSINAENLYKDSYNDRVKYVAEKILDEMALENCFEGTRFYDLMRYQMNANGGAFAPTATITMPAYLEDKYGQTPRPMTGKPWFLRLK